MSEHVLIGSGLIETAEILPRRPGRSVVAVLHTAEVEHLAHVVRGRVAGDGVAAYMRTVPSGDAAKTLDSASEIYQWFNGIGLHRTDTIVAVGGGALTDVGGFVAATYLRGLEAVYIPTTLLGAVDAAIGGKTSVNIGGKNLVGVFAHPKRVIIDLDVLERLPVDLRRDGMAEALKAGLVGDPKLVELFEEHGLGAPLEDVVRRAVAVKQRVVAEDFQESGVRAILNYGHTVGHAIEYSGGLSHGAAISVGMVAAGAISEHVVGFAEDGRQRAVIEQLALPTSVSLDREPVLDLIGLDKKRDGGGLRMALLESIGRAVVGRVDDDVLDVGLTAVGIS